VYATETGFVSVQPSSFFLKLKPGESRQNYISIRNSSEVPQKVSLKAISIEVSDSYGHVKLAEENPWSLESWISLGAPFEIEPGKSIKIPFEITVPVSVVEGSYSGGIALIQENEKIKIFKGTAIYVNIGSAGKTQLEIEDVEPNKNNLVITMSNTGTVLTQMTGSVVWYSMFGKVTGKDDLQPVVISPGRKTILSVSYADRFPGIYKADVDVFYASNTKRLRKQINVIHIPPAVPLMAGLGIGGVLLIFQQYRKKYAKK
jgi:hypothetical protein